MTDIQTAPRLLGMTREHPTWFCATCGSQEILHATVSEYDPVTQEYVFVDHGAGGLAGSETWCTKCIKDTGGDHPGDPTFGFPSENFTEEEDDE